MRPEFPDEWTESPQRKSVSPSDSELDLLFRGFIENPGAVVALDTDFNIIFANYAAADLWGFDNSEAMLGQSGSKFWQDKDSALAFSHALSRAGRWESDLTASTLDGRSMNLHICANAVHDETGKVAAYLGLFFDVSAQKENENKLKKSERRLARSQEQAKVGHAELEFATQRVTYSDQACAILGLDDGTNETSAEDFSRFVHEGDQDHLAAMYESSIAHGEPMRLEYRVVTGAGDVKNIVGYGEVETDADGEPVLYTATFHDVTEIKSTEQQLRQSQKMETIGQLSAGVAHDFNNLLAVIIGNLELSREAVADDSEIATFLDTAIQSGQRGAKLGRQLLAFSRRQTLFPEPTDLNALIDKICEMMQRTIGGLIDIEFTPCAEGYYARVDRAQFELAMMNLAINARDAMPDGGTLSIATQCETESSDDPKDTESDPIPRVCVVVSDTGFGMDEETLASAIDPFFTTKEVGQGTGLGLSMVYGFTEQSGGRFGISSAPGGGTRIEMCLPACDALVDEKTVDASKVSASGLGQTILVVDDDPHVLNVVAAQIRASGYEVTTAANADQALEILSNCPEIAMLVTDVMLGSGMNGVALAVEAKRWHARLQVLCVSGCTEAEIFEQYDRAGEIELLGKPFTKSEISGCLQKALGPHA